MTYRIIFRDFETQQSLKTYMLFDLESTQHSHFIHDDGGFWSTSKGYKVQFLSHHQVK